MAGCIFCKIIDQQTSEQAVVYKNEFVSAFLDKYPVTVGHTLVIPNQHYDNIFDVPDDILVEIMHACKKIAIQLKEQYAATGVNIMHASGRDAEQSVFHLHFHVVPRHEGDGLSMWFHSRERK